MRTSARADRAGEVRWAIMANRQPTGPREFERCSTIACVAGSPGRLWPTLP